MWPCNTERRVSHFSKECSIFSGPDGGAHQGCTLAMGTSFSFHPLICKDAHCLCMQGVHSPMQGSSLPMTAACPTILPRRYAWQSKQACLCSEASVIPEAGRQQHAASSEVSMHDADGVHIQEGTGNLQSCEQDGLYVGCISNAVHSLSLLEPAILDGILRANLSESQDGISIMLVPQECSHPCMLE